MTAPTVIQSMSGATLSISATLPPTYDAAGYTSTTGYPVMTAIGEVESFGAHGASANEIKFTSVATAVVEKVKGSKDYGSGIQYMLGNISSDAGQVICLAAVESQNHYSMKITYPIGAGATAETHYLDVLVMQYQWQNGSVDTVWKAALKVSICRKPVIIAAT